MTIACLLLAAGESRRFGRTDKMTAPLNHLPLGLHVARTLMELPFAVRLVVTNSTSLDWSGWERVPNDRPEAGIGHSIALGTAAARRIGATALLVALADMPFVPVTHFQRLSGHFQGPPSLAGSSDGRHTMPPALFGAAWFDALESLSGDSGARALLDRAAIVKATPAQLLDIDCPADLAAAEAALSQ